MSKPTPPEDTLLLPHGGYRKLRSHKVASAVYDATVVFCRRFLAHDRRMADQMVQAARSGVRNISEGSGAAATSRKSEMKLTNVGRASLADELLPDYESFLVQNGLRVWAKESREARAMRARLRQDRDENLPPAPAGTVRLEGLSGLADFVARAEPELAGNAMLCAVHQAVYLLNRQLQSQGQDFLEKGGFTERLYRERREKRSQTSPTGRTGQTRPTGPTLPSLIHGYINTQLLYVAARLGIADLLRDGPQSREALACATGIAAQALERFLLGLVTCGVLELTADERFALTPAGMLLAADHPQSLRGQALLAGELFYPAWGQLQESLQQGGTGVEKAFGRPLFEHLAHQPEVGTRFNAFMADLTARTAEALLGVYDFSSAKRLVDVGGGQGTLLAAILHAHPGLVGEVFDAPAVAAEARAQIAAAGLTARCQVQSGDFFTAVPPGADTYLLSQVLHDWDDERSILILENCRRAVAADGRVLVLERLVPEKAAQRLEVVIMDLMMLTLTGGHERTAADYARLLAAAGFELQRIIPLPSGSALLEAVAL